jgi:hypothetical protein
MAALAAISLEWQPDSPLALSFETLGLRWAAALPDQPPPPDHLENHLIWVDSIKMIPLGLKQNVPWAHSRNPKYPGYSHDTVPVILGFNQYCTGLLFCIRYPVFVIRYSFSFLFVLFAFSVLPFIRLFDLFYSCLICFVRLFSVRLFAYSVFDYSIYSVLFSVLILELYSRYFDPVKQQMYP